MGKIMIGRLTLGVCQTNCYFLYRESVAGEAADHNGAGSAAAVGKDCADSDAVGKDCADSEAVGKDGTDSAAVGKDGTDSAAAVREVIFVDPADRGEYIYEVLRKNGFKVAGILLTHGHFDHIWGADRLRELSGAPIYACEGEREVCENAKNNLSRMMGQDCVLRVDRYWPDGAEITIAGMTCRLLATPGHTTGSCCYYFADDKLLLSGDTLFQGSIGRTDFPGGSMGTLVRGVKEKLFGLPDEVKVFPGHGESTTIAEERQNNPFCQ